MLFNSCLFLVIYEIANTEYSHNWLTTEKELSYDFISSADTIRDANQIRIVPDTAYSHTFFLKAEGIDSFFNYFFTIDIEQGFNGIRMEYAYSDPYSFFDFGFFRVPHEPDKGDTLKVYYSRDSISSIYQVISNDTVISSSLGDYSCFCMENNDLFVREFWNEQAGLIKFETFNQEKEIQKTFVICAIK